MRTLMNQVTKDRLVKVKYAVHTHLPDGSSLLRPEEILEFIFGVERQPPTLENALEQAKAGERVHVHIPASEIYGEYDPSLIQEIPREGLIKQRVREGHFYRQMKKGTLISFKILKLKPDTVVADFNKPMAGISASVDIEILSVRKAGKDEIRAAFEAQSKRSIGCG